MSELIDGDTGKELKTNKPTKNHLGNLKLSSSKKALKLHLFKDGNFRFYVIPAIDIIYAKNRQGSGRVFEYVNNLAEVVGEIQPLKKGDLYYILKIKLEYYYLKSTYIDLLLNGSELTLPVYEV